MSRLSYILLFVGLVFIVLFFICLNLLWGGILPIVWVILGLGVISILTAVIRDRKFFVELLGQRTTKHGFNLGALVAIVLAILVGINFVGFKHVKKFDTTKESVHSLSDQTKKVLDNLQDEVTVKAFFTDQDGGEAQRRFADMVGMFTSYSNKVKYVMIDPIRNPEQAKENEIKTLGTAVVLYRGKKATFEDATEQGLTNAIIKTTRDKSKNIYYITGHGERDLEGADVDGAQTFKKFLMESDYAVKPLSLLQKPDIPADADVVIIAGPEQPYLESEIKAIKKYLYTGGKIFIALDPGTHTNLAALTHSLGIEFKNNYLLDTHVKIAGWGPTAIAAESFSSSNPITKGFSRYRTVFLTASELKTSLDKPPAIKVDEIVKTSEGGYAKNVLSEDNINMKPTDEHGALTVMASSIGILKNDDNLKDKAAEFSAVVVGDSDILTNKLIDKQLNHDLVMNAISYLAKDKDLVSIRPRQAKGTSLTLTQIQQGIISLTLVFVLPACLFFYGIFVWHRRRTA